MAGSGERNDDCGEKEGDVGEKTLECAIDSEEGGLVALES